LLSLISGIGDDLRENKVASPDLCALSARSQGNATQLASNYDVSCKMPCSSDLNKSVLEPHSTACDLRNAVDCSKQALGVGDNSQFSRVFSSKYEPSFDMSAPGSIAGQQINVKLDTQASTSYLPSHIAAKAGVCLGTPDRTLQASVADGHKLNVYGIYECVFQLQGQNLKASCIVADLPGDILYLGRDWLTNMGARLDFVDGCFSLQVGKDKLVFKAEEDSPETIQGIGSVLCALNLNGPSDLHQRLSSVNPLVADLLREYVDLFPESLPAGLPPYRGTQHVIDLDPTIPIKPGYTPRHSPKEKAAIEATILQLLALGLIEDSTHPFSAPVLLVEKKDGSLRMVVDYRKLNSATIKNSTPLPRLDETLDELAGAKYFTSLDLHSGYHQLRIDDSDVPKTSFKTHMGQFQFKVLPFGLSNAPATFQTAMNRVFAKYLHKFVVIYLDDIMIYSKTKEEHLKHLQLVFQLLRDSRFYLKLSKCSFMETWTLFLGYYVGPEGIKPDPAKISAVKDWPVPSNVTEVRAFLGLCNFFRRFVQGFSALALPLVSLTKKHAVFRWTYACHEGFEGLKKALTEAPILQAPDPTLPYTLVTDASGFGMGAVLLQNDKPIAYLSKRFSAAEMNYSVSEQELCATIYALKTWRHYLEGCEGLTIITDHHPNTFFQGTPVLSRRQARWYETLQRFHFTWKYEPGHTNVADPLSRCSNLLNAVAEHRQHILAAFTRAQARAADLDHATVSGQQSAPDTAAPFQNNILFQDKSISHSKLNLPGTAPGCASHLQSDDLQAQSHPTTVEGEVFSSDLDFSLPNELNQHLSGKIRSHSIPFSSELQLPGPPLLDKLKRAYQKDPQFSMSSITDKLKFHDGFWWKTVKQGHQRIVVPCDAEVKCGLIAEFHDTPSYGHMGSKRTLEVLQRYFTWPGMVVDVKRFISSCDSCQRNKPDTAGPKGLLQPLPIPDKPWNSLSFDFITCLPPTNDGHNALLVVVDRLTKMCRLVPCDFHCSAEDVARLLSTAVFSIFGVPETLISDRDPRFTSQWFQTWCKSIGIKQCMSSPYHPQTDGQTERMNRVVEDMLRHFVNPRGSDWDTFIPAAQLAINNAYQQSIKSTPFFVNFGRHPRVPGSLANDLPSPPSATSTSALLASHLHDANILLKAAQDRAVAWENAKKHIASAQEAQQKQYNKGRRDISFAVGDKVLFSTRNAGLKSTLCRKLLPKWIGPFSIVKVINPVAYKLSFPSHVKWHNVTHVSSLRKYVPGRNPPPPLPLIIDGEVNYEVEAILSHMKTGSRKGKPTFKYLIKWEGYGTEHNSWEPESNLVGTCDSLLLPYKLSHGLDSWEG
jgi:hypothetical protein